MDKKVQKFLLNTVKIIEIFLAILLSIIIIIMIGKLVLDIINIIGGTSDMKKFEEILANVFSLVIGLEFIKMICKYTPDTIIEVLLFTVARNLVVNHSSAINSLLGILAIGGIFAIKKYLFSNGKV